MDVKINSYIQTLANQRNQAMDEVVRLVGELTVATEEIKKLKEEKNESNTADS